MALVEIANVRFLKKCNGMIGSSALVSAKRKKTSITAEIVSKPMISVEFHAYSEPPQESASRSDVVVPTMPAAPSQSIGRFSPWAIAGMPMNETNTARMPTGILT